MSVEILARIQFGLTCAFHYLFPPLSIGLGLMLVIMEGMWLKTGDEAIKRMTHFWVKIFALIFGLGVATGIVLEFEFGTNWASYSRYVGDIFGSALAAEGIFAFFLESGFLALLVFGWHKVSPRVHFFSTCMVALGSTFSAVWIIIANSWMQTPRGYQIVETAQGPRAKITDFWAMVFNPSSMDRLSHTVSAAWCSAAFLVLSVGAYYLLKGRHTEMAKLSMKIGLVVAMVAVTLQFATGHKSIGGVAVNQPAKLAAMEGHVKTGPLDLALFGYVDREGRAQGLSLPRVGSILLAGDPTKSVKGLDQIPVTERPLIQPVFQFYHLMIACAMGMAALVFVGAMKWRRGTLWTSRWCLQAFVGAVLLPQIANQAGWFTAEMGRQPWIVYGMLRTSEGLSKSVKANQVMASLVLFTMLYLLLGFLFVYLLNKKIKEGPEEVIPIPPTGSPADTDLLLA
ncbi:cytochrome ubiquinol oxidase subunit I [bacterium]|nr:MAG: cytochrome ubiquinol oxidase subunit I [bacterium]